MKFSYYFFFQCTCVHSRGCVHRTHINVCAQRTYNTGKHSLILVRTILFTLKSWTIIYLIHWLTMAMNIILTANRRKYRSRYSRKLCWRSDGALTVSDTFFRNQWRHNVSKWELSNNKDSNVNTNNNRCSLLYENNDNN